jgi:type IV fimbrial biogenesis protein FimT
MFVTRSHRGFSLIELMVTLTVLGILLAAAVPAFGTWTANARVRSVAESIQNGLRLAQTEAVRRNRQTVFALTNATPASGAAPTANGSNWFIQSLPLVAGDPGAEFVQGGTFAKQSGVTITGAALMCFNSTGRQVTNAATGLGATCTAPASVTAPSIFDVARTGSDRPMRVQISLGGQIRMCDPAKSISSQPDGC